MEYYKQIGRERRSRHNSFVFVTLTESIALSGTSWNSAVDRLDKMLSGFSFPNFPQFPDTRHSNRVSIYFVPSENKLVGRKMFSFGTSGSRTPPTPEQVQVVDNTLRSFGIKEIPQDLPRRADCNGLWFIKPTLTMKIRGDVLTLEITKDLSSVTNIPAHEIIGLYESDKGEYYNRLLRRSPISFSAKPQFEMIIERNTFGLRIVAPFNPQKTDIEMVKDYLNRSVSDLREASMRRKADGEYKLGPASGMVRGLRYGEEDEFLDEDLMAEFDPNEIGEETDPRSYGHFTQQEWGEISDIFYNPRMARLDDDLARRFGITIKHLNKLLNKVELAEKFASKIDTVGEKATRRSLVKLKEAIDFHDLMTNADLNFLYSAVERRLPDTRMASDEHLADFYKESVGAYYDGLNRNQRKLLDNYLRQSGDIEYDFDDLPRNLKGKLYDFDDLADEFRYHTGHYQLEESVSVYLRENDTRPYRMAGDHSADIDGNYMSVQNIKEIQDMANFLAQQVHNGENMEDWVEDKISSARQMLSDLTRYYSNGEKEMKGLDNWKYAKRQEGTESGAEGYFADIPYLRETREFAQSGEDTNVPSIDPKAQKNTPPTPSEIEQDDDVKTLGRVKVEEQSVKQDKKASATERLLAQWKCLGEE